MSGSSYFQRVVSAPDPVAFIREMSNGHLDHAIHEIAQIAEPNAYQAEIYARLVNEAAERWRGSLLSLDLLETE